LPFKIRTGSTKVKVSDPRLPFPLSLLTPHSGRSVEVESPTGSPLPSVPPTPFIMQLWTRSYDKYLSVLRKG